MNLRDLKYLVAVAQHKHFGKAADACFVSQPTLSAQLKKLEEELEVQLFERNNKKVLITPTGAALIEQARVVLREAEQLKALAKQVQDPLAGPFRLGIIPTLGPYLLPHILPTIRKELPKLELFLYEDKTEHIIQRLEKGMLDALILALPITSSNLVTKELFKEPFLVALPKNHALNKKKTLRLEELAEESLLLLEDGHCLRDQALEVCQKAQVREKTDYHATSLETLRHMVGAGHGITLLPTLAITKDSLLNIRPLTPNQPHRKIGMVWRKQNSRTAASERIVELVRGVAPNILANSVK